MLPCNRIIVVGMKAGTAMGLPVGLLVDMKAGTGMGSPGSWSLVWSIFLLFVSNVTECRNPIYGLALVTLRIPKSNPPS